MTNTGGAFSARLRCQKIDPLALPLQPAVAAGAVRQRRGRRFGNGCQWHRRQQTNTASTATLSMTIRRRWLGAPHVANALNQQQTRVLSSSAETEAATRWLTIRVPTWRTEIPTTSTRTLRCVLFVSRFMHTLSTGLRGFRALPWQRSGTRRLAQL